MLRTCNCKAMLALLLIHPSASAAKENRTADLLNVRIHNFQVVNANIHDALLKLGSESGIPLGIVATDPGLWQSKVSLKLDATTVRSLLQQILPLDTGYGWRFEGRTLVIGPRKHITSAHILQVKIRHFQIHHPATAESLSIKLWMELLTQANGRPRNFAGIVHPSQSDKELPAVDLSGRSVEEILNWIVAEHGAAAWVAMPPRDDVQESPVDELWKLVFYQETTPSKKILNP